MKKEIKTKPHLPVAGWMVAKRGLNRSRRSARINLKIKKAAGTDRRTLLKLPCTLLGGEARVQNRNLSAKPKRVSATAGDKKKK